MSNSLWLYGLQHARLPCLSPTPRDRLLKLMFIVSVMPSNHLILCRPFLLPSILPSIRVFSNESALCIRWPKYQSFSFSISPSNEYSGLISFRIDWPYLTSSLIPFCLSLCLEEVNEAILKGVNSKRSKFFFWHFNFIRLNFILESSRLTMLWWFQMESKGTQPYIYT